MSLVWEENIDKIVKSQDLYMHGILFYSSKMEEKTKRVAVPLIILPLVAGRILTIDKAFNTI